ncbi:unknown protein, partial [Aleutian mink disease parvovirus]|uniref:hypothetical protein n=1 Tax=Aleutian mink disease parvovirus TaxID=28314 RepID=UPI00000F93A9
HILNANFKPTSIYEVTLLYRDYWTKLECHNCHEEYWQLTTYYCKECRKCEHGKLRHTKKECEQCACKAAQETSA